MATTRKKSGSSSSRSSRGGNGRGGSRGNGAGSKTTTDHDEIRQWAEARGAKPSCVRGTGGGGDTGMLRLDFPGFSGAESLQEISWDEWFEQFDDQGLALLYQEETAGGERSNFNKLVSRDTAARGGSRGGSHGGGSSRSKSSSPESSSSRRGRASASKSGGGKSRGSSATGRKGGKSSRGGAKARSKR